MKKTILLLLIFCCLACFAATAQEKNTEKDYKWAVCVQLNTIDKMAPLATMNTGIDNRYLNDGDRKNKSFALGITGNYFVRQNISVRFKAGITKNDIAEHSEYNIFVDTYTVEDIHIKEQSLNFAPGISYNFNKKQFGFYCGLEVPVIIHDAINIEHDNDTRFIADNSIYWASNVKRKAPGGYSVGPGAFIGFSIFPVKHFSIGGEFASAFLYSKIGGKVIDHQIITDYTSNVEDITKTYPDTVEDFSFSKQNFSLNISLLF